MAPTPDTVHNVGCSRCTPTSFPWPLSRLLPLRPRRAVTTTRRRPSTVIWNAGVNRLRVAQAPLIPYIALSPATLCGRTFLALSSACQGLCAAACAAASSALRTLNCITCGRQGQNGQGGGCDWSFTAMHDTGSANALTSGAECLGFGMAMEEVGLAARAGKPCAMIL